MAGRRAVSTAVQYFSSTNIVGGILQTASTPSRLLRKCSRSRRYHEVSYAKHGSNPSDVLVYRSDPEIHDRDPPNSGDWVRVEMLHAPWNPADVNTVQGRYPSPYPSKIPKGYLRIPSKECLGRYFDGDPVIGSEGWGRVTHSWETTIPPGTLVTTGLPGLGTLRSSLWVPASALLVVPDVVPERLGPSGASLFQLGGTALRMLSDFVPLASGDVVIQNAGTSGVGFLASQLAASPSLFGTPPPVVVSLIRRGNKSRESLQETVDYLTKVGKNAFVVAEEDLFLPSDDDTSEGTRTIDESALRRMKERLKDLSPTGSLPRLALNAVGGDSARLLLKLLEPGSTMVTYGGMSGRPVQVATPQLIFGDVRLAGYWHSRWMVRQQIQKTGDRRASMVETLSRLVLEEDFQCPPAHVVGLKDLKHGLEWQADGLSSQIHPIRTKLVWDCRETGEEDPRGPTNA